MKTLQEGIYKGVAARDYHADPAPEPSLSSGLVRTLLNFSPLHARHRHPRLAPPGELIQTHNKRCDIGTVAHSMLLHQDEEIRICDERDWRKDSAKALRDDAYANDCVPILRHQLDEVRKMVAAARRQLAQHQCGDAFVPGAAGLEGAHEPRFLRL